MSDFNSLHQEIISLTSQSARFRRVVLHLHSPQSYDFGDTPNSDSKLNNKDKFLVEGGEKLFLSHLGNSVDLVAVTDHMRSGYACKLSNFVIENKHAVRILPGIELNIRLQAPLNQLKLHMIVIFPEGKSLGEIERIFPNAEIPSDEKRTGKEELDIPDLAKYIKKIRDEHQGICIAAHVDNKSGIRMLFRQTGKETISLFNPDGKLSPDDERKISDSFKDFLAQVNFDGIEITKPEDRNHYSWQSEPEKGIIHHVPVFLTFDGHNIEALNALSGERKERITYVKMADVSWQGLRAAIQFPLTRIRFSDDRVPPPYILGVQIISGTGHGFFSDLKLGFAENLNCLIGVRGSGKSTVVDAIRYVFGYNRTLDELGSADLKKAVKDRQKATLQDSIIRIFYRINDREVHILEATYGGEKADYVTKVYDVDGNLIHIDDVERSGKYPLRLFGWSEIETLGRDPERQMDLLDKLVEGLKEFTVRRDTIRSDLRVNSETVLAQAQRLVEIYQRNDNEIKRYQEHKQEFDKYNTQEVENLFKNLDNARDQKSILDELREEIVEFQSDIHDLTPVDFEINLKDDLEKNPVLKAWWDSIISAKLILSQSQANIQENLENALKTISLLLSFVSDLTISTGNEIENLTGEIRKIVSVDPEQQVLADLRTQSKDRLDNVERLREEYAEAYDNLVDLLNQRKVIIENLNTTQENITSLRQEKKTDLEVRLNEYQTDDMQVEIRLIPNGNKDQFRIKLQGLKYLGDVHRLYRSKKWPEILSNTMTPKEFGQTIFNSHYDPFIASQEIDGTECSIDSEDAQKILNSLTPFREDLASSVTEIDIEKLDAVLNIEETEWDDKVSILRNGQLIESASPGQRSSAMLPLIALAEKVPLVIDQPEDNLDNRLVGKVLVDILAKLKEKRQIIVCTHNPNIVVLGDAEQVIVMEAIDNYHGRAEDTQASIDHPEIIKRVIELMEGGRDAFETRRKRYEQ